LRSIGGKWVPVFVVFAGVDDAGADAGYFELGVLKLDGDVVFGGLVEQGEDVAFEGGDADGGVLGLGDDIFCALLIGHGARPGDPEDAAGKGRLLAPEADAELDAEIAFFFAPGVDAVGAGQRVCAVKVMTLSTEKCDIQHMTPICGGHILNVRIRKQQPHTF
jgi:hypothetical protein